MILTVDIGNTTVALGIVRQGKVMRLERLDTSAAPGRLRRVLAIFKKEGYVFDRVMICSVVAPVTIIAQRIIRKEAKAEIKVVGRDIIVPIKNRYKNPGQVGQDRLVGAYAALRLYGKPLIVIDLGTAITLDAVSAKGEYLGGAIVPGLRLSAESLFLKTALLPEIALQAPKGVVGRTTEESMLSGLFYGYGCLCRGMIELIARQLRARPKVVMTGGHTHLMKKFIAPKIRIIDEHLVHKGMALLAGA